MSEVITAEKATEAAVNTAVITKPVRKSLRKDKAAAKFSGSPGLKAFAALATDGVAPVATTPNSAKTAAKASAKPKVTPAKPVAVKAAKKAEAPVVTVPFVARKYVKGQPIYSLDDASRPASGRLLLAHTHAALSVLGLLDAKRPATKKSQLLTLIGQRAVNYHVGNGNLEAAPDFGIRLSILGYNSFNARVAANKIDGAAAMAYQAAFLDGVADSKIGIKKDNLYQAVFA